MTFWKGIGDRRGGEGMVMGQKMEESSQEIQWSVGEVGKACLSVEVLTEG
jgi:hypothetical protein